MILSYETNRCLLFENYKLINTSVDGRALIEKLIIFRMVAWCQECF